MKSKLLVLFLTLFLIAGFTITGLAQPVAKITVESVSPWDITNGQIDTTQYKSPSTGLKTVGVGDAVYLTGHEMNDSTVTAYAWSITGQPTGSTATLDHTDTQWVSFRPDTTGDFVVELTVTTAEGTGTTSVTIVSSTYVGVGIWTDKSTLTGCLCHPSKIDEWVGTAHPTLFREGIEGIASDHYAEHCIECHTVGFNTDSTAVNGGFDDVMKDVGWTFPDTLVAGNWDSLVTNYPDLAKLASIQCENCHGPAETHRSTFNPAKMDISLDEGVCGRCHEDGHYHIKNTQWLNSGHSVTISEHAADSETCGVCHSAYGFVKKVDPDSEPDWKGTGMGQITCAVCHDPHSASLEHQVRSLKDATLFNGQVITAGGMGKLCMNCHISRRNAKEYVKEYHSHYGPHHSPQTDMLFGTNAILFGIPYVPSSPHKNLEDACVTCHMSATPAAGSPAHNKLGEHSFAMHWDGGTPDDPSDDVDNVAVCQECHGPITTFEDIMAQKDHDGDGTVEGALEELRGLMEEVAVLLPPLDSNKVVVTPAYNPIQLRAAYNYLFVQEDKSHGVHNYQFSVGILKLAKAALHYGELAPGNILSIKDIPADQGKQVRVMWDRFGGDGISNNPIQFYALWRRVDNMMVESAPQNSVVYKSLDQVPSNANSLKEGAALQLDNVMWDFVSTVPATALLQYSTVAPTLYDSTAAGVKWSVFKVSGHTAVNTIFVVSDADSGYSVDNLAPTPPMNLAGEPAEGGISLTWAEPVDEDFNYFAIYRGDAPGFDPTGMTPIATTAEIEYLDTNVNENASYYYKLSAFDFAGNESQTSNELAVTFTGIADANNAIPTDFVLKQNYPNPFNPSTMIRFGLPGVDKVSIVIYDILGKPIRTLASGQFNAGYHNIVWDGKDQMGHVVSAGVYIYRLESSTKNITMKMLFVK